MNVDAPTSSVLSMLESFYTGREYKQAQLPLNTTSHFLICDLVGHLLEFIKISLAPPMLKIDNFT